MSPKSPVENPEDDDPPKLLQRVLLVNRNAIKQRETAALSRNAVQSRPTGQNAPRSCGGDGKEHPRCGLWIGVAKFGRIQKRRRRGLRGVASVL